MRIRAGGKIFKRVMPHDQPGFRHDHAHSRHARITIGIDEINPAADKDIRIVGAASDQNDSTKDRDLENRTNDTPHAVVSNRKSKMENRKCAVGPPGFEPGTKGL